MNNCPTCGAAANFLGSRNCWWCPKCECKVPDPSERAQSEYPEDTETPDMFAEATA